MNATASPTASSHHRSTAVVVTALLAASVVANLVLLGIGSLLGADMTVDNGGTLLAVGALEVTMASLVPLALGIALYVLLAPRFELVARWWMPTVVVVTVLSLAAPAGATDLTSGIVLGMMHVVVGAIAAFAVPARLGR